MTVQYDLFGGQAITGDIRDRITYLLETYPDTRNSYKTLMARYWLEFDGLADLLGLETMHAAFLQWFTIHATSPKTIQNRCMEIQNARSDLEANPNVEAWRQRQARAGVVK